MSYYSIYFSPTGGTKKAAYAVAEGWGEPFKPVDMIKDKECGHKIFTSGDLCLIAVPSYGGRVPEAALERLREMCGNGARAVLIAVFGNRAIDDTLLELSDEAKKVGFRVIAAMEAVAQHSLLPQFGAGRPDAEDTQELKSFAQRIRNAVENGKISAELKLPGNRPYKQYRGVPLKPYVADGCIGCGICAEECPVGAIPMLNFRTTDGRKCISCMRCVTVCPKHVRKLNKLMTAAAALAMKKSCADRKPNQLYL